ncbi:hypothetical protein [Nocardia sp. NBC_01009]|nr:hypothetical protein OHA42_14240 [Nocardia sp. NBC_01009]
MSMLHIGRSEPFLVSAHEAGVVPRQAIGSEPPISRTSATVAGRSRRF